MTDLDGFDHLHAQRTDEVNFWRPSPRPLGPIPAGAPFAFKLKSPRNRIGGVGFFVNAWDVPLSMAWQAFATRNGFSDYAAFRAKILSLHAPDASPDPVIRCHALTDVTFFTDQEQFGPPDWSANIVSGRMFDTEKADGARLWDELAARLANRQRAFSSESLAVGPRYGVPLLVKPRLGQGAFRFEVMEAYRRRCAVTGERTLPVLEAAHIRPFASEGPHALENGIFLRSDIHALFDLGYLTVRRDGGARDLRLVVSGRIREEYENGRDYYALHDKVLANLPERPEALPSREFLQWHNDAVYRG
ncbi:MAG: HNH endonuclease [Candidatus Baltobacteraceae bacterium]